MVACNSHQTTPRSRARDQLSHEIGTALAWGGELWSFRAGHAHLDTTDGNEAKGIRLTIHEPIGRVSRATNDVFPRRPWLIDRLAAARPCHSGKLNDCG